MRTPLYEAHLARHARMAPFAGWEMPIQYDGILREHLHTRSLCSVFDTCHMGEIELRGATAADDLERLLTCRIADLAVGRCRYGYLLNEEGGVLDDLTCYRLGPSRFWLVVNASTRPSDFPWIRARCSPSTEVEDISDRLAKLDVQGPTSLAAIEQAFAIRLPELGYFRWATVTLNGTETLISRTGYTGEWGYELYFPVDRALEFWTQLLSVPDVRPAGLGARDTLRLEMGYPLYGHELGPDRTPAGVAEGRFLDLGKPFIGRDRVREELTRGPAEKLVGLLMEGRRAARAGAPVWADGREVGIVTSGSYAPSLGRAVALAYVSAPQAEPGRVLSVRAGDRMPLAGRVEPLPFYRHGTARRAPAARKEGVP